MSTLRVATVETENNSTDLTLKTGNTSGPSIILHSNAGNLEATSNNEVTYLYDHSALLHILYLSNTQIAQFNSLGGFKLGDGSSGERTTITNESANNDGDFTLVAGNTWPSGARIRLYGENHATYPGDVEIAGPSNEIVYQYDHSALTHTWSISNTEVFSTNSSVFSISNGLYANGSLGTDGQVLTSNGTVAYWSDASGGITTGKAIAMAMIFG